MTIGAFVNDHHLAMMVNVMVIRYMSPRHTCFARYPSSRLQKAKSCCWAYASWEACQREYRSSAGTGYRTTVTAGTSTSSTRQSRARHETRKYDSEYSFRHCHFLLSPDFRKRDYSLHENKNDTEKK
jgi:hypothetical protein